MTLLIIIITVIISITAFNRNDVFDKFRFYPYGILHNSRWYCFITSGFIHSDLMHLMVNMFVLYSFGSNLEYFMKIFYGDNYLLIFLVFYLTSLVFPLINSYRKNRDNPQYSAVGASGAVSAVVFACIVYNPLSGISIMFIPFQIPAYIFGILYIVYSEIMSRKNIDNIGHDVHLMGAVYGLLFTVLLKPELIIRMINIIKGDLL